MLWMGVTLFCSPSFAQWPPQLYQTFPDHLEYYDQNGETVKISQFKGKVLLIEYVGMNCPACQAFSGANTYIGPFKNNAVQKGLKSIEQYCPLYAAGIKINNPNIVFLQILLYDMRLGHPGKNDARAWAKHFRLKTKNEQYVLVSKKDLRGKASYNLIPGFQLVDKQFILKSNSTGHHPQHNLYSHLLPMIPELIGRRR